MDIYFTKAYGQLYEEMENGSCEEFGYESPLGTVRHLFIKREIPFRVNDQAYFDLVTPYGYGGPLVNAKCAASKKQLIREFETRFTEYCQENRIVSEFVRFHPLTGNAEDFQECYEITHIRNTVGTDLKTFDDPFNSEFSKSCRKKVRKGLSAGITYRVTEQPTDLSDFKRIYYSTMDRNDADGFYYFDETYFSRCLKSLKENLLLVDVMYQGEIIGSGLYFISGEMIHVHLSGTKRDFLHLSPAYILRFAIAEWGKANGYTMIHHGGGRTNEVDDSLYVFKKRFGQNTGFKFHTGKRIWNVVIYEELCRQVGMEPDTGFFPAYRATEPPIQLSSVSG